MYLIKKRKKEKYTLIYETQIGMNNRFMVMSRKTKFITVRSYILIKCIALYNILYLFILPREYTSLLKKLLAR